MSDKPTFDTNILIYAFGKSDDANKQIAKSIIANCSIIRFSFWDSMMIASALDNHCSVIYTEDLQHGQVIENKLKIINPFINHKA
jgi:predicted nucleic acid-binding protein